MLRERSRRRSRLCFHGDSWVLLKTRFIIESKTLNEQIYAML